MAAKKKAGKKKSEGEEADVPFEKALDELERIVEKLEQGEVPLDESLQLYEKGVKAYRRCRGILDRAEKRIQVLVRDDDGSLSVQDMDDAGSGSGRLPGGDLFGGIDEADA